MVSPELRGLDGRSGMNGKMVFIYKNVWGLGFGSTEIIVFEKLFDPAVKDMNGENIMKIPKELFIDIQGQQ
jgi:hypothetical protein